jgi:hypothetical protein
MSGKEIAKAFLNLFSTDVIKNTVMIDKNCFQ